MISKLTSLSLAFVVLVCANAAAQEPEQPRSVEDRLSALERQVASLQTRLGVRTTVPQTSPRSAVEAQALSRRVEQLERRLDALTAQVKRVEQQTDAAMREALQAHRQAALAEQLARDAGR
jgi:chaperonin cofactor prefoldin